MNKAYFFGHIGRDCEVRHTNNGTPVANFPLGVKAGYGDKQQTLWVDCALFGKRAEGNLPQYLVKGAAVVVDGEVNQRTFQKNDGTQGAALTLNVQGVDLAGGGGGQQNQPQKPQQQPQQPQQLQQQPQQQQQGPDQAVDFDDDLPF